LIDEEVYKLCHSMPKAELHVHLEGSTRFETVFDLAEKNKVQLPFTSIFLLRRACSFESFRDFSKIYDIIVSSIRHPEDLGRLVSEFAERMVADNIVYSEVTWTPQLHVTDEYPFEVWLEAVNAARRVVEKRYSVVLRWILDILRDRPSSRMDVVDWMGAKSTGESGIVGLGLGGTEEEYPPNLFIDVFHLARSKGINIVPHAGEHKGCLSGPSSIWSAINELDADRIGHGNRAIEDPELVKVLVKRKIPLELCPTSNIELGLYKNMKAHPLHDLFVAGCIVTINTDDPEIFGTTLTDEYVHVIVRLGCSIDDVCQMNDNAFEFAFDKEAALLAKKNAISAR